jgi:hypothetical protein
MSVEVLEVVDTFSSLDDVVPCSGLGHHGGPSAWLHGDLSLPAEWLIRHTCPNCNYTGTRPVCDYFKQHGVPGTYKGLCGKCGFRDEAWKFYTVLHRL